jgi:hypothetical protein
MTGQRYWFQPVTKSTRNNADAVGRHKGARISARNRKGPAPSSRRGFLERVGYRHQELPEKQSPQPGRGERQDQSGVRVDETKIGGNGVGCEKPGFQRKHQGQRAAARR